MRKTVTFLVGSFVVLATLAISSPASATPYTTFTAQGNGYVSFHTAGSASTGEYFVFRDTVTNGKYVWAHVKWTDKGRSFVRQWRNNTYSRTLNWAFNEGVPVTFQACEGNSTSIEWRTCGGWRRAIA